MLVWLHTPISDAAWPRIRSKYLWLLMAWHLVAIVLLQSLDPIEPGPSGTVPDEPIVTVILMLELPLLTLLEEVIFRFLPLVIARAIWAKSVIPVLLLSSIGFGLAHGEHEWFHIFFQGVSGFVFGTAFLKRGGWDREWSKALLASWSMHLWWDLVLFGIILVLQILLAMLPSL